MLTVDTIPRLSLAAMNVHVLPVSEVENTLVLPKPFVELAKLLKFDEAAAKKKLKELTARMFKQASADVDRCIIDATRRRIDYATKAIGLTARSSTESLKEFAAAIAKIDPAVIYQSCGRSSMGPLRPRTILRFFGFMTTRGSFPKPAESLGLKGRKELEEFIGRAIPSKKDGAAFLEALRRELPTLQVKRTLGIGVRIARRSDPRAEIKDATVKTSTTGITTPFAVEYARTSEKTRKGAPTLLGPVNAGGAPVQAQIFVLSDGVSEKRRGTDSRRRETGHKGSYHAEKPGPMTLSSSS